MYKVLRADRDAYITDKVVKNVRSFSANVGAAGSLDLFKLYGLTSSGSSPSSPNVELSRLLIHFDLQPLRDLVAAGRVDPSNGSFACSLDLFDVYGGQTTPSNFTVAVHPLSRSFDEGLGRDVAFFSDLDVCNFLTGSASQGAWLLSGCFLGGGVPGAVDYITASTQVNGGASLKATQLFVTGEEDMSIDVTTIVSATLAGLLPDAGFRVSLDAVHENDQSTYFVKRFASRTAFNEDKHPRLNVQFDDSIQDDTQILTFDSPGTLVLFNYAQQVRKNLTSGSALTPVTGSNCLILKLATDVSGGVYNLVFTGSQHRNGTSFVTGVYSASINVPSFDSTLAAKLAASGSVDFTPIWGSLDGTQAYLTGSTVTVRPPLRGSTSIDPKKFVVTVLGLQPTHRTTEQVVLRVSLFDFTSPLVTVVKLPVELPSAVVRDVHYQVRDDATGNIEIPFDLVHNSTRVSADATKMYFTLDVSNLTSERSYVIDVLVATGDNQQTYLGASPVFRVSNER